MIEILLIFGITITSIVLITGFMGLLILIYGAKNETVDESEDE